MMTEITNVTRAIIDVGIVNRVAIMTRMNNHRDVTGPVVMKGMTIGTIASAVEEATTAKDIR
jgi:hypothetical protein